MVDTGRRPTDGRKGCESSAEAPAILSSVLDSRPESGVRSAEKDGSPVEFSVRRRAREVGGLRAGALWDGDGVPRR